MHCVFSASRHGDPDWFPVTISRVCRSWRLFVMGSPTLWASISLSGKAASIERNRVWLERSREALLYVEIRAEGFQKASVKAMREIVHLLLPHGHRFRILNVTDELPVKVLRMFFDRLRDVEMPYLQEVKVETFDRWRCPRWNPPLSHSKLPRLERLSLQCFRFDWKSPLLQNLRALRLALTPNFTPAVARDILQHAPRLKALVIMMYDEVDPSWYRAERSTTPLELTIHDSLDYLFVPPLIMTHLQRFRFSALRHLDTGVYEPWEPSWGPSPPLNDVFPQLDRITLTLRQGGIPEDLERHTRDILCGFSTMTSITTVAFEDTVFVEEDLDCDPELFSRLGARFPPRTDTVIIEDGYVGESLWNMLGLVLSRDDRDDITPIRRLTLKVSNWKTLEEDGNFEFLRSQVQELTLGPPEPDDMKSYWEGD